MSTPTISELERVAADRVPVKFWTCCEDDELLNFTDPHDAVTDYLENALRPDELSELPDEINVYGFAPMPITAHTCGYESWAVERLLEQIDEEYGNQIDLTPTEPTKAMLKAAKVFVARVIREYEVWTCEQVAAIKYETDLKGRGLL